MTIPLTFLCRYNSAIYTTTPINNPYITIVTPDYLEGGPVDTGTSYDTYQWRRQQYLYGLDESENLNLKLECQKKDGNHDFNLLITGVGSPCGVADNPDLSYADCPSILTDFQAGLYSKTLTPLECLTAYSFPFGNQSSLIVISEYDDLANESTTVANASNFLLFTRTIYQGQLLDFWGADGHYFHWLCGSTNSFDCRRF